MFDVAEAARKWNSEQVYEVVQRALLRWALRPARRENAWHDVEQAMLALTAIAIKSPIDPDGAVLKGQLAKALQAEQIPSAALLRGVAAGMRRAAEDYDQQMLRTQGWDQILAALEAEKRNELLRGLAQILDGAAAD